MDTKKPGNRSVVPWSLVVAGLLILSLTLCVTPGVEAQGTSTNTEDFEDDTVLDPPEASWYSFGTVGSGGSVTVSSNWGADNSTKSLKTETTTSGGIGGRFSVEGDFCAAGSELRFSTNVTATGIAVVGLTNSNSPIDSQPTGFYFKLTSSGIEAVAEAPGQSATTVIILPLNTNQQYDLRITNIDCAAMEATFQELISETSQTIDAAGSISDLGTIASFSYQSGDTHFVDDLAATFASTESEGTFYCPSPAEALFGYNYVEDVEFVNNFQSGLDPGELADFYEFQGSTSNNAYLAKGWPTTPTQNMYTRATLESQAEGTGSTFRFAFSYVDPTPFISADNFTTAAKGDGSTTGVFANVTEVVFTETGNDWEIVVEEVFSGSGRVQTGAGFLGLNPNTPTSLEIGLNSTSGEELVYVENEFGTRLLEIIPSHQGGKDIFSLWLVGAGTAIGVSRTALNDNDGDWNSSCMFFNDLEDSTFTPLGNRGVAPFNQEVEDEGTTATPTGGIGSGIFGDTDTEAASAFFGGSTGAANFFFGALFIVGMAAAAPALTSGTRIDATPSMIAGGVLGLVMGWAFGFISGTFMFVLVVLSVAGVGLWFWGRS